MAYEFGLLNFAAFGKAKQWLKGKAGTYSNGKPPLDNAVDNNYQNYSDNAAATGAIATYKECNAANQFEINNGHTLIDNSLTINAVAVPATPTAVVNGATGGGTSNTYKVVGRSGSLQAPSATVSPSTCQATLTAANSVTLTFKPTPGFLTYDVYRTVSGGTPSSTGLIGHVAAALGPNVLTPTLSFTDTGLAADGSTAPTTNTTGGISGDVNIYGNLNLNALSTPHAPMLTVVGTSGGATVAYKIVARSGSVAISTGHTAASAAGSIGTANATLSATNYVRLDWQPVPGAVSYDVYRTTASGTSPTTTGLIASTAATTLNDTGVAGDSSTAPITNTTGQSSVLTSTAPSLVSVNDTNGNVELNLTATGSAVDYITVTNGATGTPGLVSLAADGSDTNVSLTISPKGNGVLRLANQTAAPTVNIAAISTAGATISVASAATATGNTDTLNIATGNAAGTGKKIVNIATGVPNTTGNNQVLVGGGAKTAVTVNAVATNYTAFNYQATESGANNALACALTDAGGSNITQAAGLRILLKLAHSMQASGGNTLALNGASPVAIKKASNPANDTAVARVSGSIIDVVFDGTVYQLMSE